MSESYYRFGGTCCLHLHLSIRITSAMKVEAAASTETLVTLYQATRSCIPEDSNSHIYHRWNSKF
jgi:hypothetical protein